MRIESARPFPGFLIVGAAFFLSFASGPGQSFAFSVFQPAILADTGLTSSRFSLIYALGSGFSALVASFLGVGLDRYGARPTTFLLGLLLGLACLGMSLAGSFLSLLLALALLRAVGQGCLPTTAQFLTSQWFVLRRGWALSLAAMGVVASNAILPPLALHLIERLGWRGAYLWIGLSLALSLILLAWLAIRNRPEDLGLHPDGAAEPIPELDPAPEATASQSGGAWKTARFWTLVLPLSAPPFAATAAIFHQASLFEAQGLSTRHSAHALSVLAIAAAGATLTAGRFLDRFGPRPMTTLSLLLLAAAMGLLGTIASPALAVLYSVCLGASVGLWGVTNGATWPHHYGRRRLGTVQGNATTVILVAAAVGPLPVALLHGLFHSHTAGIALLLAISAVAALLTILRKALPPA